jgi:hypothetical protein
MISSQTSWEEKLRSQFIILVDAHDGGVVEDVDNVPSDVRVVSVTETGE